MIQELSKEELMDKCSERIEIQSTNIKKACTLLEEQFHIKKYKVVDHETLYIYEQLNASAQMNTYLVQNGIEVSSISINNESLESYFLDLTSERG